MKFTFQYMWWNHFKHWIFDLSNGRNSGVQEIAGWLEADIQEADSANRMIERLRGIQAGKEKKGYIGTGNAHHIYAFDESLYLVCEYVDDLKVVLPIEEAIKALEGFAQFKSGDWQNPSYEPAPFTVIYDYEGAEAEARYAASGLPWGLTAEDIAENTRKIKATDGKRKGRKS